MQQDNQRFRHTVVIGAGLTGLTAAHTLKKRGVDVEIIEKTARIGGQMQTLAEEDFVFETGPNTGVISCPEVVELFQDLQAFGCEMEEANEETKQRWIWKKGKFHALPTRLSSSISTTLFTWKDKFRILLEPFRPKGTNPDESVEELVKRRLGDSYVHYAVDPFISGIYAGNPKTLVTRYALPRLYNLEHTYGSFIRGAIAKAKEKKTDRDRLATKKVFAAKGGFGALVEALGKAIGSDCITLNAANIHVKPVNDKWEVIYTNGQGMEQTIVCQKVITTIGSYVLPQVLPFVEDDLMSFITNLRYAPVVQVAVGVGDTQGVEHRAFGGLIPSCEGLDILGVLFPSSCFPHRAPKGGAVYSFFLGGMRQPQLIEWSDEEIMNLVKEKMHTMLGLPAHVQPDISHIFRHRYAIPQYEASSGQRLAAIETIQKHYPGLILAGNIRDGIGMADRIKQGVKIGNE